MAVLDDARNYINARYGAGYTAWMALSDADASRTLVSATAYIDSFQWQGTATGLVGSLPTSLQWPRSGVFVDGVELDSTTVPVQIVEACFELAVMILADSTLVNTLDAGSNVQSLGAGPAKISFFRPTSRADGTATTLPPLINRLIGRFLASSVPTPLGFSSGVNSRSNFVLGRSSWCTCSATPCCCPEQRPDRSWPV